MAYPQGINFRATSGFVTDGSGDTFEIGTTANYPRTTPQGNVVGWEDAITGSRDRAVQDPRLSGVHYLTSSSGVTARFRFDLPAAGSYDIRLAAGDYSGAAYAKIELFDTAASLGVLVNRAASPTSGANTFFDATGTEYSAANWPGSNTVVTKVFTTTICRFKIGAGFGVNETITHLRVSATGSSTPSGTISYTEANDTSAITASVTVGNPAATISYTEANDTSAITGSVAASGGTLTTGTFKNNTGSVLASLTGLTVTVLLASTLAFVKSFASQTTNGSGVMSITDPLFAAGTVYAVVTTNASGTLGVEKYTAA